MSRRTVSRRQLTAALGAAVGVGLAGCGGATNNSTNVTDETVGTVEEVTDEETPVETEAETEGSAEAAPETTDDPAAAVADGMTVVRIAHLSPDAPNVDVSIAGQEVLTDVGYTDVSQYYAFAPGTYPVTVTATGESEPVLEREIEFQVGAFTVGAFGEVSGNNQELAINVFDDEVEPPSEGTSARVVNAVPDASSISVTGEEADVTVDGVAFAEASEYVDVQVGDYELQVTATEGATTGTANATGTATETANATGTGTPMGSPTETGTPMETETPTGTSTSAAGEAVGMADVSFEAGAVMTLFVTGYGTPEGESADAPLEVLAVVDSGAAETGTSTPVGTGTATPDGTSTGGGEETGTPTEAAETTTDSGA
ncbi:DUF4397 domain-containing protein [Halobaculum sp. WSA2]|uniref:DUF4397 domain-containing protein n=1 Tax=Halobaculum saliterrae TaxID=2073113 RepID=A0A6B0ST96_9EURY|nr:DUF4397 domain-containing protein [Halobaculum saliterrae]MXR39891.1 DUF4397 domain-containing protein [Halobaculum saliterrae]